ncbi:rod shape-determining protein RodA [Chrysiogenes arsenatis]|uniref:rod shape-determining protein RodA n=1 Tax=Chrysiogenes arsenatis TaxID=309797 RepID=UPI000403D803|nr:rod shape-determining protein RodA [Chrysiogenes arsenatis]
MIPKKEKKRLFFFELIGRLDWLLIFFIVSLCGYGLLMVHTSTYDAITSTPSPLFYKQAMWIGIGLVAMFFMAFIDYHYLVKSAFIWYLLLLAILVFVLLHGSVGMGAQRWIRIGGIAFQPSEFGKLVLVLVFARYFSEYAPKENLGLKDIWKPLLLLSVPVVMIAKQPDLGTALVFVFLFVIITFVSGIRIKLLINTIAVGILSLPLLWASMRDYQKRRVLNFLDPESDPFGAGYHVIQSKIAIGSGGLFGKGLLEGTQSQLRFLPERHTDFIFSVMAEELGMIGCLIFFSLFFMLVLRGFEIARSAKDKEGFVLAVGILSIFVLHSFINLGMTMGLLPVVGVPLPFLSYGGSSMVMVLAGLGVVLNIRVRRLRFNSENDVIVH